MFLTKINYPLGQGFCGWYSSSKVVPCGVKTWVSFGLLPGPCLTHAVPLRSENPSFPCPPPCFPLTKVLVINLFSLGLHLGSCCEVFCCWFGVASATSGATSRERTKYLSFILLSSKSSKVIWIDKTLKQTLRELKRVNPSCLMYLPSIS